MLIRDLDPAVLDSLKEHARVNKRSLQAELKHILELAASRKAVDYRKEIERFRERFGDRVFSNSADLIREDRER